MAVAMRHPLDPGDKGVGHCGNLSRHTGRQVDRHVDVFEIEHGQHALSCGNHLTGAGKPVLHATASRGHQHQVDQNRLQPLDIGLGCPDRSLGLIPLSAGIRARVRFASAGA